MADHGIVVVQATSNITITNNDIRDINTDAGATGIGIFFNAATGNVGTVLINKNRIGTASLSGGIQGIQWGSSGFNPTGAIIVENNIIQNCLQGGIQDFGSDATWRYNLLFNLSVGSDAPGVNLRDGATSKLYYNLVTGAGKAGVRVMELANNVEVFNNVFYKNNTSGTVQAAEIDLFDTTNPATNTLVKNNICVPFAETSTYKVIEVVNVGAGTVFDNNLYSADYTGMILWGATTYDTLAAFVAGESQDANSISGDPLMVDPANRDFHLLPTSPAIDAGADVSLTQDFAGTSVPRGVAEDIGAFEHTGMIGPRMMMGVGT